MNYCIKKNDYLMHHGILGQRWGVRRFQNEDGSLTNAGEKRYSRSDRIKEARAIRDEYYKRLDAKRKDLEYSDDDAYSIMDKYDYDQSEWDKVYKTKEYKAIEKRQERARKYVDDALKGHTLDEINKTASMKTGKEIVGKILKTSGTIAGTAIGTGIGIAVTSHVMRKMAGN